MAPSETCVASSCVVLPGFLHRRETNFSHCLILQISQISPLISVSLLQWFLLFVLITGFHCLTRERLGLVSALESQNRISLLPWIKPMVRQLTAGDEWCHIMKVLMKLLDLKISFFLVRNIHIFKNECWKSRKVEGYGI